MWKRALVAIAAVLGVILIGGAVSLVHAHIGIRQIRPELPSLGMVQALSLIHI